MRAIAVIGLASVLCACATVSAPEAGDWKIERGFDRIAGKPAAGATLSARSRNSNEERNPGTFPPVASLFLGCFDNAPVVRLDFNHRVGSNRTSKVNYRFDENPGRDTSARFLQTYKTIVIEDQKDVSRFVNELRTSNKLFVRVMSHVAGTSTVDFSVKGAGTAADAAYVNCPVSAPLNQRTSDLSTGNRQPFVSN